MVLIYEEGVFRGELDSLNRRFKGCFEYNNGDVFEGEWREEKRYRGRMLFANGDSFEGEWTKGEKTAKGVLTFADGDRYEGSFKNNQIHGKGVYTYACGDRFEGKWRMGVRISGKYIFADGTVIKGKTNDKGIICGKCV